MKNQAIRLGLAVGLVALVFLVLAAFSWNFVRDAIAVPVYYLLGIATLVLNSIPQSVYLGILLLLCFGIGLFTVGGIQLSPRPENAPPKQSQSFSRYLLWKSMCDNLSSSNFSMEHFVGETRGLIVSILAFQEGIDVNEVAERIESVDLSVPPAVKRLVLNKDIRISQRPPDPMSWLRWLLQAGNQQKPQRKPIDPAVAQIVEYIEHLLEIEHGGSQ